MRLAVQTPLVPGASLAEQWALASRLGFDALELAGPDVPAQAEEAQGAGIPISALCGGQRPGEDTLRRVAQSLRGLVDAT